MINCPNCGTENRDGSKFCNDCGHLLGKAAGVTCTMCGAQNPPGSEFCAECGARLVLLDAPADDIGMISDAATMPIAETVEDAGLPDWLDRLRSAAPEEDAGRRRKVFETAGKRSRPPETGRRGHCTFAVSR